MNVDIEPQKGPKKVFAEGFACRIVNGILMVSFVSGEEQTTYALPLAPGKALGRAITKQVQEVEKKMGKEIPDIILSDEPVPSPLDLDTDAK